MLVGATAALGQSYPTRPIKLVVGFGPGGVADVTARVVGQKLGAILGQTIIVENKPTAGGIVAADSVAKAEPDGYTLLLMTNGNAVSASLFRSLPYDIRKDFAPVSTLGFFDVAIVAGRDSHIDSLSDMIAYAKTNPGKLDIGTINVGSTQYLAAELFKSMTGMDATIVPFNGSPAVIEALRRNEVQIGFEMLAPIVPQAKSGAVKILAVASERRYPGLPDVPTAGEAGVPGYTASSWNAIAAPANTPREVIERLNRAINQALAAPEVQQKLALQGVVARGSTPAQMGKLVGDDIEKWRKVIESANIERQ
ncbi:MAG: tripartite tricarboxylate transporter substrate binding protein [Betaproteobacteria bacterium]|nr:tripartite tricarboxylate transporter substrate binding protein [Betaproteobacteria bacterium]MDE2002937.1 tripartite tricarboxylate transporter substrate binding protein [Betaproteobacteria bacterium]MDE2209330.1 tripartite tricarboxylate transporter substrate binding protein [Betaproteobacteria bacterium]MDE2358621.1 tripartite tricarboxylate transporter substrate binding protein [Betaproteobacteria bacterium]